MNRPDPPAEPDTINDLARRLIARDDIALPPRFHERTVTIEPGQTLDYVARDWNDALVIVDVGSIEIEGVSGRRYRFDRHAILHLTDLPIRAVRNVGCTGAVLIAISRRNRPAPRRDRGTPPAAQDTARTAPEPNKKFGGHR